MITAKELTEPNECAHVYEDIDQIRLVKEDGELVGWYRPSLESEDTPAQNGYAAMVMGMLE